MMVDDEPMMLEIVQAFLEEAGYRNFVNVADSTRAIERLVAANPDILLLDLDMPEVDGFDVMIELGDALPVTVMVTAFDVYALRAFEHHAVDYVLKPYDASRVQRAVAHASDRIAADESHALAARLGRLLADRAGPRGVADADAPPWASRLTIQDGERHYFVEVDRIDWIEVSGNYVTLHVGDERHNVRSTLKAMLSRLDPSTFVRIHRSAAVNLSRVREVQPWFGGDHVAILRSGVQLRVSRTHRARFLSLFH